MNREYVLIIKDHRWLNYKILIKWDSLYEKASICSSLLANSIEEFIEKNIIRDSEGCISWPYFEYSPLVFDSYKEAKEISRIIECSETKVKCYIVPTKRKNEQQPIEVFSRN
jgi:hypothetical protein